MIGPPVGQLVPHPIEYARVDRVGCHRADNAAHGDGTRERPIRDGTGARFAGAAAFTPWASPAIVLALGAVLALTVGNPLPGPTAAGAKWLL
ncbi:MAG: hypothetical protein ABIY46_08015 [Gemmatimonadales bacterium]